MYYYSITRVYGINSTINFILLCLLYNTQNNKTEYINILEDCMHVFMVQIPLFKGLELSMNLSPTLTYIP